jgi:hypothetical protein
VDVEGGTVDFERGFDGILSLYTHHFLITTFSFVPRPSCPVVRPIRPPPGPNGQTAYTGRQGHRSPVQTLYDAWASRRDAFET